MLTTKKDVCDKIKSYILSFYNPQDYNVKTAAEALKLDMEAIKDSRKIITDYQAGAELAKVGQYAIYTGDMIEALKDWGIDDGKQYSTDKSIALYMHLIGRESEKLVKKLN